MNWIVYPLAAATLWAIVDTLDKHIVSDELKDPLVCASMFGFTSFLILGIVSLSLGNVLQVSLEGKILAALSGFLLVIGTSFYYAGFKRGKISRLAPLLPTRALWVVIISFLFLGERLAISQYLGIFILLGGVILISFEKGVEYKFNFALILILFMTLSLGGRDILFKLAKNVGIANVFSLLFWVAVGAFLTSTVFFIFHHPHILRKAKKGIEHVILNGALNNTALLISLYAISIYPVSLISSVSSITPLIIFFLALFLTKFRPDIIYEKFSRTNLIINFVASFLVVIGAILIYV